MASFFSIKIGGKIPIMEAKFGNYKTPFGLINSLAFLHHERIPQHSSTWLPEGNYIEERERIKKLREEYKNKVVDSINTTRPLGSLLAISGLFSKLLDENGVLNQYKLEDIHHDDKRFGLT